MSWTAFLPSNQLFYLSHSGLLDRLTCFPIRPAWRVFLLHHRSPSRRKHRKPKRASKLQTSSFEYLSICRKSIRNGRPSFGDPTIHDPAGTGLFPKTSRTSEVFGLNGPLYDVQRTAFQVADSISLQNHIARCRQTQSVLGDVFDSKLRFWDDRSSIAAICGNFCGNFAKIAGQAGINPP